MSLVVMLAPAADLPVRHRVFLNALGLSLLAHAAVLATHPGLRPGIATLPDEIRLDARLLPAPPPAPAPLPAPRLEAPAPRPAEPPRPVARQERAAVPLTAPREAPPEPAPVLSAPPTPEAPRAEFQVAPPAAPTAAAPTAAAPRREAPPAPSGELVRAYGHELSRALAAQRRYPRVAQLRGWQGTVEIEVEFRPGGALGGVAVTSSSGYPVLDEQALEMLRNADLPARPGSLRERAFALRVPVEFRLRN